MTEEIISTQMTLKQTYLHIQRLIFSSFLRNPASHKGLFVQIWEITPAQREFSIELIAD